MLWIYESITINWGDTFPPAPGQAIKKYCRAERSSGQEAGRETEGFLPPFLKKRSAKLKVWQYF